MARSLIGHALIASSVGALDGIAASADTHAGRAWHPVGEGVQGGVVLGLGWAPTVQIGAAGLGGALYVGGHAAPGLLFPGLALLARSAGFYVAQRGSKPPVPTQG